MVCRTVVEHEIGSSKRFPSRRAVGLQVYLSMEGVSIGAECPRWVQAVWKRFSGDRDETLNQEAGLRGKNDSSTLPCGLNSCAIGLGVRVLTQSGSTCEVGDCARNVGCWGISGRANGMARTSLVSQELPNFGLL